MPWAGTFRRPMQHETEPLSMKSWFTTEDGWAVWLGLFLIALGLPVVAGVDLLGWTASTKVWPDPTKAAVGPVSKNYAELSGGVSLVLTFLFVLALIGVGAWFLRLNLRRFVPAFAVIFWVSYLCWIAGHYAYIAATPDKLTKLEINRSLGLTGEAGYIVALLVGLVFGNIFLAQLSG